MDVFTVQRKELVLLHTQLIDHHFDDPKFADLFKIHSVFAGWSETVTQRRQSQHFCATYSIHTIRVQQPSSAVYFISRRLACARHVFKGTQNGYTIKSTSEIIILTTHTFLNYREFEFA
jgi:hypothetical protein